MKVYNASLIAAFAAATSAAFAIYLLQRRRKSKRGNTLLEGNLHPCSISAPGKALIAGGYLVLDAENVGLVVAASARFYSSILISSSAGSQRSEDALHITVISAQFHQKVDFLFEISTGACTCISEANNAFIEKCIQLVLLFIKGTVGASTFNDTVSLIVKTGSLRITLQADNDFYSQINALSDANLPLMSDSLRKIKRFNECPLLPDGSVKIAKTGMGSSAALTTSLVAALLHFFGVVKLGQRKADEDRRLIHNLSQLVHSLGTFV